MLREGGQLCWTALGTRKAGTGNYETKERRTSLESRESMLLKNENFLEPSPVSRSQARETRARIHAARIHASRCTVKHEPGPF